jgi:evolved beta-galactosidase subunit beta
VEIFSSRDELARVAGTVRVRAWQRVLQAIRTVEGEGAGEASLPEQVMFSLGDSLTYMRTRRRYATDLFTGHRRYVEVVAAGPGGLRLEIATKAGLEPLDDYSDLTDREHFCGTGEAIDLAAGAIAVLSFEEAVRYPEVSAAPAVVVHVA